jgi:hypothetical protein
MRTFARAGTPYREGISDGDVPGEKGSMIAGRSDDRRGKKA